MAQEIAYFDNAATTFPKPECVYDFADSFYRSNGGNIGRGNNALSRNAGLIAANAKDNLRILYGCPTRKVVFTASATDALNRIILGIGLNRGDNVFITPFEHNAVTRPLNYLEKSIGVSVRELPFDSETLEPRFDAITEAFAAYPPKLVIMTHASNVCGAVVPVMEISRLAKEYGATTLVDMSQTAGLLDLDLASASIDYAVFAGHKTLYAPFGIGGFFCLPDAHLNPVLFGGNGINSLDQEMPRDIVQMEEIGSQNVYAIAGLKASTDWLLSCSIPEINARESIVRDRLIDLLGQYGNIGIIGNKMSCPRIGVVSAVFESYSPDEIENVMNGQGVAVRSGLHCSPYAHRFLGTLPGGTVRFSVSALTEPNDFMRLEKALDLIAES